MYDDRSLENVKILVSFKKMQKSQYGNCMRYFGLKVTTDESAQLGM
jgi:hypothetical protein